MSPGQPRIAILSDSRLSRERGQILDRAFYSLGAYANIQYLPADSDEAGVLKSLEAAKEPFHLVLVPWYRYLAWSKIEAFYGLTRTSGPTFAGYFGDRVMPYELGEQAGQNRAIILDYYKISREESIRMTLAVASDKLRWGIEPILDEKSKIWFTEVETHSPTFAGKLMSDLVLLEQAPWNSRSLQIQSALIALLSFNLSSQSKGALNISGDAHSLVFRFVFTMAGWNSPKDALSCFWPNLSPTWSAAYLLRKATDWLRVHFIPETRQVEMIAGFSAHAPSLENPDELKTFWIEPLSVALVKETAVGEPLSSKNPLDERIRSLEQKLKDSEKLVQEMKSGGVGVKT